MNEMITSGAWMVAAIGTLVPIAGIAMVVLFVWFGERRRERESFHRSELLKKIAESPGDAAQKVLAMIRQQEHDAQIRRREGMKLGGLITMAVGIGLMPMLYMLERNEPAWIVGLIPLLVGAALLVYVLLIAPKPMREDRGSS
jgi:hypothetical protein